MFGLAVACLAFGAATRNEEETPAASVQPAAAKAKATASERFFIDQVIVPVAGKSRIPIEALLLQIENHVRLEQAAAESFLDSPTPAMLHSRTISPLVN
jgi:hypothetical protein